MIHDYQEMFPCPDCSRYPCRCREREAREIEDAHAELHNLAVLMGVSTIKEPNDDDHTNQPDA